jgi:hypothetical protein
VEPTENRGPASGPDPVNAPAPAPVPPPATDPGPAPATPTTPTPAPRGDATATRDGAALHLTMCKVLDANGTTLEIWGGITDPSFQVDEGIIAVEVTPPDARGTMTCGKDVRVVFAEARGAEFDADPNVCSVQLATNALGQVEGHVSAEYVDQASKRHAFTVDFTAGDCN